LPEANLFSGSNMLLLECIPWLILLHVTATTYEKMVTKHGNGHTVRHASFVFFLVQWLYC
jgi:hypothetical protein